MKKPLYALLLISLLGALVTGYLTYAHYTGAPPVCVIGDHDSCAAVTQSSYSMLMGMPVALWGFLAWLALLSFSYHLYTTHKADPEGKHKSIAWVIFLITALSVPAAGYFNGIMLLKLQALCAWCETSHLLMLAAFFFSAYLAFGMGKEHWTRNAAITAAILISIPFFIGGYAGSDPAVTNLAKCLTEKNVTFYGAFWCPHCKDQKAMFGTEAMKEILYVECADPANPNRQTQQCIDENIDGYPTWIRGDGKRQSGAVPLEFLAQWADCDFK